MTRTRHAVGLLALGSLLVALAVGLSIPAASATVPGENSTAAANGSLNVTVWTAPASQFDAFDSPTAIREMKTNGTLTRDQSIANRDMVVFAIESPETVAAFERATDGSRNDTEAFVDLFGQSGEYAFLTRQQNPTAMFEPKELNLTETAAADGLAVVTDSANGTLFVALETNRAVFEGGYHRSVVVDDRFNTTVLGTDTRANTTWVVVERTVQFVTGAGDVIRVGASQRCTVIDGRTSVAPGTRLSVRFDGPGDQFPVESTAVVAPGGTVSVRLDAVRPRNSTLEVSVSTIDESATEIVVGAHDPRSHTTVRFDDQSVRNGTVIIESVTTYDGGFIVLYPLSVVEDIVIRTMSDGCVETRINRTLAADSMLGVSEYFAPGIHEDVTVRLDSGLDANRTLVAVPHRDTNDNGTFDFPVVAPNARQSDRSVIDRPISLNGSLITDAASVTVPTTTDTATPITTPNTSKTPPPTTDTPPTRSTDTATQPGASATTTGTGPGFGPGLAVLALLVAGLLGLRR